MRGVCFALLTVGCSGISQQSPGSTDDAVCPAGTSIGTTSSRAGEPLGSAPSSPRGACDPSGWVVTASPSAAGDAPDHAVDGLPATRWSTGKGQGPGQYLQVSFGGWLSLSRLTLESGGGNVTDYLRGYELRASLDGVTFDKILASGSQSLPPLGGIQVIDFFPTSLQALRIESIQPSGNWWSVHELNVDCYGSDSRYDDVLRCDPSAETAAPSPAHWSSSASRSGVLDRAGAAFDDDMTTSWSTGSPQTATDWFQLDLGKTSCISNLRMLSPDGEAANAYTVEVSVDGINYVQVAEGLRDDGPEVRFEPHAARFARVNQVGSGASNWWRIQELQAGP